MQHLVDEAARRAPAIREWLDRLENRDVTVYIRAKALTRSTSKGASRCCQRAGAIAT